MEPILDKYVNDLKGNRPYLALARIYCEMFDRKFDQRVMAMFNKLCKVYNTELVLFSLLDMYDVENINFNNNAYGLLVYFIKNRVEKKVKPQEKLLNLNQYATELEKKILNE